MEQTSKKIDISKVLSNNGEVTEKDIMALLVLIKRGRISNPKLLRELNLKGANLNAPESAGHYRVKLEKMGVIEGYPARINWEKVGYPTEFVVIMASSSKNTLLEIEREHIAGIKEYRQRTGADIMVIPLSERDNVILKDIQHGGEKSLSIIWGIATSDEASTMFADFYLPKRFPGIDTNLLIIHRSSIRDFEVQDKSIESLIQVLFSEDELEEYTKNFRKEFRWDLLKPSKK